MVHKGQCFCGAVEIEVTGEPEGMGYCHCRSCRSWSGGPVNAFSLWKPEAVKVTAGNEYLATFQKTPQSQRQYCAKCGGHLMTNHPALTLIDVFAATMESLLGASTKAFDQMSSIAKQFSDLAESNMKAASAATTKAVSATAAAAKKPAAKK